MSRIVHARIEHRRLPLRRPYVLALGTLEAFDALLCRLTWDDGRTSMGEVVPLPGYSDETLESTWRHAEEWRPALVGLDPSLARAYLRQLSARAPCAASLWLSAIDYFDVAADVATGCLRPVPLVHATSSAEPRLQEEAAAARRRGFTTLKVKIGTDLRQDLAALAPLSRGLAPDVRLRFDANQGYTEKQALHFFGALEETLAGQTELVEQPVARDAWAVMERLAASTDIPLMLDEPVCSRDDVARARGVGCQWVKLKLCKQGSVTQLQQTAREARRLGLKVVVGNGVATDVANLLELWAFDRHPGLFDGASESTGFAKIHEPVLYPALGVRAGHAIW